MQIYVPKETLTGETRIPIVPQTVKRLTNAGAQIEIEAGVGTAIHMPDDAYADAGATVSGDPHASLANADLVLRLRKPSLDQIHAMKDGAILAGMLEPFSSPDLVRALAEGKVSALSMEMIPRSTIAQKMDALSSQANLGGYVAVILGAERMNKILPMMMTPAGTIAPARVFVIGVGVAGLQAIATAKRLGARVEAFDTRPVVEEQVQSLGAKFVKVDLGETGETEQGYAKELTEEQQARQREAMAKVCAQADLVITTAQLFGRPAPRIVTREMVSGMKPGSVIVDMAVESGGNVDGSELDQEVEIDGVRIVGLRNLPGRVPDVASQMYSANLGNLVEHFWNTEDKRFELNLSDEIIDSSLITHGGEIRHKAVRERIEAAAE